MMPGTSLSKRDALSEQFSIDNLQKLHKEKARIDKFMHEYRSDIDDHRQSQ